MLLVFANTVVVTLMLEAISSSETSVLIRVTWSNIPEVHVYISRMNSIAQLHSPPKALRSFFVAYINRRTTVKVFQLPQYGVSTYLISV
jgi:hypothetical protein